MPTPQLPERASLDFIKKMSTDRLRELRLADPDAKLAAARLSVAREFGFSDWRTLKAEVELRQAATHKVFFDACASGDTETLLRLIAAAPGLVQAANPGAPHGGWTGLHTAAGKGHLDAVRLLLDRGADPNAREAGDNTYPLHWAAANRHVEVALALLGAGGDVHGSGDVHELDAIGWATFFHKPGGAPGSDPETAALLVEHGARHHIFSAICLGDLNLIRAVMRRDPRATERRMSRFEQGLTPLHFAIGQKRYDILDLLIELGSDLEARDGSRLTALEAAMLRGDREASARLLAAGAKEPARAPSARVSRELSKLAGTVGKCVAMISVADVAATLEWYLSVGFKEVARYADDGVVNFGMVALGKAEIMFSIHGERRQRDLSLWFYTDKVDDFYQLLKSRQIDATTIDFAEHINDTFYGARQFGIRDPNGYTLYFIQPVA